jgi:integrase
VAKLKEMNIRTGFFEREQLQAVINQLPEYIRRIALFCYITGWRIRSEVLLLQWRHVDFKAGRITLDPGSTKNDDGRVFPFTSEMRALLEAQWKETQELQRRRGIVVPWVFHRHGVQLKTFYEAWRNACTRAGLPGRLVHDFRRTAVRNLIRAGVPERVAMQLTGHKARSVFDRYHIVAESDLIEAARHLDDARNTGTI